ncbi:MAG: hypothetical protein LUE64_03130 [Candidatus Gastranaerophilales bacterium]|nr:hypothetical protein [Candidatus Gastranaerophilales bacterium]
MAGVSNVQSVNNAVNNKEKAAPKKKKSKKDFYNETPIRKLGFLDEYGEALRPILETSSKPFIRQLPNIAYIPATAYMLADVADKYQKGLDGTGEQPSLKMAAREAAYQGIVSVAAPVGIVKATHKLTGKLAGKMADKLPKGIKNMTDTALNGVKQNKTAGKVISKAGMPAKFLGAVLSIIAVSRLTKPVDFVTKKFFEKVVDPKIGVKNSDE